MNKPIVSPASVISAFLYLLVFPVILFLLAGDWRWTEGWVFSVIFLLMCFVPVIYLYFNDQALLKERFASPIQKEQKRWDKFLLLLFLIDFLVWFAIMPLDARRFGWSSPFPLWAKVMGTLLLILSGVLIFEVFRENTFASPVVKMQKERGQKVISTGLYGIVRHPMYTGASLLFISSPMLLGSVYGLVMGMGLVVILAARSIGEEAMLTRELEGYSQYKSKVRWRLIPFVF